MNWRTHAEAPAHLPATALIAVQDPDGTYYLLGIFMQPLHRPGVWLSEDEGCVLHDARYWWMPEEDLLAPLPDLAARLGARESA